MTQVCSVQDHDSTISHPLFWHPIQGPHLCASRAPGMLHRSREATPGFAQTAQLGGKPDAWEPSAGTLCQYLSCKHRSGGKLVWGGMAGPVPTAVRLTLSLLPAPTFQVVAAGLGANLIASHYHPSLCFSQGLPYDDDVFQVCGPGCRAPGRGGTGTRDPGGQRPCMVMACASRAL